MPSFRQAGSLAAIVLVWLLAGCGSDGGGGPHHAAFGEGDEYGTLAGATQSFGSVHDRGHG